MRWLKFAATFVDCSAAPARLEAEQEAGASYFILDLGRYLSDAEFGRAAETFMSKIAA